MALNKEEFEKKCIEVIEQIVLLDYKQNRKTAVEIALKMLEKSKLKYPQGVVDIYQRVYDEFLNCSDTEYEILKKQLFDIKK